MKFMEEFKKDLIELFKKHGIIPLKDSVELHFAPLYGYRYDVNARRDVLVKFSQLLTDTEEIDEHINKYGVTYMDNYFNIYI